MDPGIVIVGGGQAGAQAAIVARQSGYTGPVTIIGDESYVPYERPPLSKSFLAGEVPEDRMFMRPPEFYAGKDVALRLATHVDGIDRTTKHVILRGGNTIAYGRLILATGGRVRRMDCAGDDLPGVHYLRTIHDVLGFRDRLVAGANVVIVGGGYVGLEVAAVAIKRGCKVAVLESAPRVLSRVVAPQISQFYTHAHAAAGVDIYTSTTVMGFAGDGRVAEVLTDHKTFAADIVIVGIGIVPNVELAADAGLVVDNGIVVDECARTADPDIFAAGDCTNHPNALLGTRLRLESVPNALSQGRTAALAALGKPEPYHEVPWFWSDQYDLKLQMTGLAGADDVVVVRGSMAERKFTACYLRGGVFVACHAVNMAKDFLQSKKLIAASLRPDPARLADVTVALKDL